MANTPCSCTCDLPSGATLPSTRSGRKAISGYFALSRMLACIRLSRAGLPLSPLAASTTDRKSTRLNSSHLGISYAVFCLKKNNTHLNSSPLAGFEPGHLVEESIQRLD